ncbi:hypothetical protein KSS87_020295, partial [Heliosperma pusillum]
IEFSNCEISLSIVTNRSKTSGVLTNLTNLIHKFQISISKSYKTHIITIIKIYKFDYSLLFTTIILFDFFKS